MPIRKFDPDLPAIGDGRSTPAQIMEALEDLFRALPRQPRIGANLSAEDAINGIGRQLLAMAPHQPRLPVQPRNTREALLQASSKLYNALETTSNETLRAMGYRGPTASNLRLTVALLHRAALKHPIAVPRGAPPRRHSAAITKVVAEHYFHITGRKPTVPRRINEINGANVAYGRFLDLITNVFQILGVNASPESQANAIVRHWKD